MHLVMRSYEISQGSSNSFCESSFFLSRSFFVLPRMEIISPTEYVGPLMELSQGRRGEFIDMQYLTETRTTIVYNLPLAEVCCMPWPKCFFPEEAEVCDAS